MQSALFSHNMFILFFFKSMKRIKRRKIKLLFFSNLENYHQMNGNNNNLTCNQNQISKNLPLKKRRTYMIDSQTTNDEQDENHSKIIKP